MDEFIQEIYLGVRPEVAGLRVDTPTIRAGMAEFIALGTTNPPETAYMFERVGRLSFNEQRTIFAAALKGSDAEAIRRLMEMEYAQTEEAKDALSAEINHIWYLYRQDQESSQDALIAFIPWINGNVVRSMIFTTIEFGDIKVQKAFADHYRLVGKRANVFLAAAAKLGDKESIEFWKGQNPTKITRAFEEAFMRRDIEILKVMEEQFPRADEEWTRGLSRLMAMNEPSGPFEAYLLRKHFDRFSFLPSLLKLAVDAKDRPRIKYILDNYFDELSRVRGVDDLWDRSPGDPEELAEGKVWGVENYQAAYVIAVKLDRRDDVLRLYQQHREKLGPYAAGRAVNIAENIDEPFGELVYEQLHTIRKDRAALVRTALRDLPSQVTEHRIFPFLRARDYQTLEEEEE